jgi:hypothetical protein
MQTGELMQAVPFQTVPAGHWTEEELTQAEPFQKVPEGH